MFPSQVSSEMTAGRLRAEIVSQKALSPDKDWVLFEVIDNGAMGECCIQSPVTSSIVLFHCS